MTDLQQHLIRQMVFSRATFGPGERMDGVLDHMTKEIAEVRDAGGDASEWVDLVILSLDGLTRRLWAVSDYQKTADEVAEEACRMIVGKQSRNERRDWPDWRSADPENARLREFLPFLREKAAAASDRNVRYTLTAIADAFEKVLNGETK